MVLTYELGNKNRNFTVGSDYRLQYLFFLRKGDSAEVSETMEKNDGESLETPESSDKSDENSETSETTNGDAENGSSSEEAVSVITDGGKYDFNK